MIQPTVLILDVDETLSDMLPLAARLEHVGLPRHLTETWFSNTHRDGFALTAAGAYSDFASMARSALESIVATADNVTAAPADAVEFVLSGLGELALYDDVRPALERLHAAGIRIVTLTNASAAETTSLLERGGVIDLVEQCLSVDDVGRWKPAPDPYRYALARCAVPASEAMLVAVHPWDIDGAKRAGLRAAWINRRGIPYPQTCRDPDLVAYGFVALAAGLTSDHENPTIGLCDAAE